MPMLNYLMSSLASLHEFLLYADILICSHEEKSRKKRKSKKSELRFKCLEALYHHHILFRSSFFLAHDIMYFLTLAILIKC